jgi:hypothetical protein
MKNRIGYLLIPGFIAFCSFPTLAQLTFRSMEQSLQHDKSELRASATVRDSTQILLPFWDDFSRTTYMPDSNHWFVDIGTTNISTSLGFAPPTVNAASFDGWNNLGIPYSTVQLEEGAGDSLVSRYIDLGGINPALFETTYISFFWQKEGRGEMPDETDSIRLQVINADKDWVTIWKKVGADVAATDKFFDEIIQLSDPSYFHDYFQLRFQSFGRLSGGFDTWNIDYVYLNVNRNSGDTAFEDRALFTTPSNWLTTYTAMPYDQFLANLEANLQTTKSGVSNLDDQVQPIEFYSLILDSTKIYDEMNQGTPYNLAPKTQTEIDSEPIDPNVFDRTNDSISLKLETRFYITSGDSANWLNKYDLRVNDTTSSFVVLDKELAYDDGTAEWAAGLSQQSAMLAYRFVLPNPDIITSVNIYFPEFSPSAAGRTFTLVIWEDVFRYREGRLLSEQHVVKRSAALNEYTSYDLGRPVAVADTFYVGYEQSIADFFPVGLDKSGITREGNVFINLDGIWEPSNIIEGNLMIRPVFGFEAAVGLEDEIFRGIKVYPNPSHGRFNIAGEFEAGWIYDTMGNVIHRIGQSADNQEIIMNSGRGLYLLKILKQGKYKTIKLVID